MENLKAIYAHLSPDKFSFSKELELSKYTFSDIPEYAYVSFEQSKKILGDNVIVLDNTNISDESHKELESFFNLCKTCFPSFYKDTFWLLTLIRLHTVYHYCKENNINEFIHLEYDNLIYHDPAVLRTLPPSIYFTRVGPYCSSAGFVYCNSLESFGKFIEKIKQLITKGEYNVKRFTPYTHLSEMIMIDLIHTHSKNVIDYLPILPFGIGNDNFSKLNMLFDGASYGQYLGGTNNGHGPGWHENHHYIGQELNKNTIKVVFEDYKPYVIFDSKRIPIMNLHVHSKNLKNYAFKE